MTVGSRSLVSRVAVAGFLLALVAVGLLGTVSAAVGVALQTITPTAATTVDNTFVDPRWTGGRALERPAGARRARFPGSTALHTPSDVARSRTAEWGD